LARRSKYDRLARGYDRRWAFYLRESIARTRAHVRLEPYQRMLDVGCGTGQLLEQLSGQVPTATLIGVDPSEGMLAVAHDRVPTARLIVGIAEALPIRSGSIDWLVAASMFHYVRDPLAARREFRRVLKPGGTLVLTDWSADSVTGRLQARWSQAIDPAVRHVYTALELQAILVASGFAVTMERYKINWWWGLMTVVAVKPA
jgi:ubiquinone/menaquinone biosynthesis C-methylase UbiE